jgi:DNA ligase (NAD+)
MRADYQSMSLDELLRLYDEATLSYYGDGEAIMSDEDFDELREWLEMFHYENPEVQKRLNGIFSDETQHTETVSDKTVMLSLCKFKMEKHDAVSKLNKFLDYRKDLYRAPKFDGMSIKVEMSDGRIVRCQTRGGQDVTNKLSMHRHIQKCLQDFPDKHFIHGELLIRKDVFQRYFSDGEEYTSIRNCVPGILKTREPFEINELLDFVPCTDGINPLINTSVWHRMENPSLELYRLASYLEELRKPDFPYQVDGVVIGYVEESGVQRIKDNYPLNIAACKFRNKSVKTRVINIEWEQKKTGKLTPILIVEPVEYDGTICRKANGYNFENLRMKHIGLGAEITITKTGDIIPVACEVLKRSDDIKMPECEYQKIGKHLVAVDKEASTQYKFVLGLRMFQIDGIGPKIAQQIGTACKFDIVELFNPMLKPTVRDIIGSGAVWEKFQHFYEIKNLYLDQLIEMLQFDGCGKILSKKFAMILSKQDMNTQGINKTVLSMVCRGEGFQRINNAVKQLATYGIKVLKPIAIDDSVITFEMSNAPVSGITKEEFVKRLKEKMPNAIHTTLTKTTNYLVVDTLSATSSKANKARKYNIPMITYEDALAGKMKTTKDSN